MAAPASLRSGDWYAALTLRERVALLREAAPQSLADDRDAQRADRRLQSWRSQFPFLVGASLADRLKLDGVTEEEFLCLLGASGGIPAGSLWGSPSLVGHSGPRLRSFRLARSAALTIVEWASGGRRFPDRAAADHFRGLEAYGRGSRHSPGSRACCRSIAMAAVELLLANLPGRLLWMLGRTMVLELHVARLRKLLQGETPAERFQSFINRLRRPETALAILQEYPVLARQLVNAIENWAAATIEFLSRLAADWEQIRGTFNLTGDSGSLVNVTGNLGDSHRAGRMVLIATFASGFKLVYKRRGMAVDVHFQSCWSG